MSFQVHRECQTGVESHYKHYAVVIYRDQNQYPECRFQSINNPDDGHRLFDLGTEMGKFVAYYRVSTRAQSTSGLGIEGQQAAVASFLKPCDTVIATFTEVEWAETANVHSWVQPSGLPACIALPC